MPSLLQVVRLVWHPRPKKHATGIFFDGLSSPRRNIERFWWAFGDLNPGPSGYEPDALTNWAKGPSFKILLGRKFAATYAVAANSWMAPQVGLEPTTLRLTAACSTDWAIEECKCARRVIFPGRLQPSIFTVNELNYCVRNGNRCTLITINTHYHSFQYFPMISYQYRSVKTKFWWPVGESNSRLRRERPPSWPLDQRATFGLVLYSLP